MANTPGPTKSRTLDDSTPRFLFVLKRRRTPPQDELLAKESRQIESMILMLCGLVLAAILLLILRFVHQHWR